MEGKITGGRGGGEGERALFTNSLEDAAKERENRLDERRVSFAKGGRRICERRQLSRGRRGGRSSIELRAH